MKNPVAVFIAFMVMLVLIMSISGYIIGARRKQPLSGFLALYTVVFGAFFLIEYALLERLPSLHATLSNLNCYDCWWNT